MSKKLNRRNFIKRGAIAGAAAAAAPMIIPRHVLGQDGKPGANERIVIAGIGIGRQGGGLINHFHEWMDDAEVAAIADVDKAQAEKMAAAVGGKAYTDYREVLDHDDIDAIITATPDHWRALVVIHSAQAGKDIYAEKPMSYTIREGRKMVEAVRKYKRVFQTGSQQRSLSQNYKGCMMVRNGLAGKITKVVGKNYPSPWISQLPGEPIPDRIDWERWCGPAELVPYHSQIEAPRGNPGWISFRRFSGGEMTGWGAHGLDQIQWALGMDESDPVEIWTEGEPFHPPVFSKPAGRGEAQEQTSTPKVFMKYANGIVLELGDGPAGGGRFIGDKATITIDRASVTSDPPELARELTREDLEKMDVQLYHSTNHYQNWLDCIKTREKTVADVAIGHRSTTVCHLGNIARWTGRHLKYDPVKEVFVGDHEANYFLDAPRRKGYELPDKV